MRICLLTLLLINILNASEERLYFFGNCIACHMESNKKTAPHFAEIKGYYLMAYPQKEVFIEKMANWIHDPKAESALMHDAVEKYGVMPYLSFDLYTLKKIAKYIFENSEFEN
ncbi:MAG: cytochrome C [Helicobacteraceae bacterium]|nr:cytochrome C [Helicobacteraceae bacterium]